MVKKLRIYRPILGSLLIFSASLSCSLALASQCAPKTALDPADSLRRLYAAAMKIDRDAFLAELTPDFYAFDGGKRYSRDEFGTYLKHCMTKVRFMFGVLQRRIRI